MTRQTIDVRPIAGALGAEIDGVDLARPLADATLAETRRAFLEYLVVFFRDQRLNPDPPVFSYGLLPAKLFLRIRERLIDVASSRGAPVVRRTE